jgi:hypothetical protein
MRIKTLLVLAAMTVATPFAQAAPNLGATTQSFSCDVNTGYCTCSGSWDGADCKGMFPNCKVQEPPGTIWHSCEIGKGCECKMFRVGPKLSRVPRAPTTRQINP